MDKTTYAWECQCNLTPYEHHIVLVSYRNGNLLPDSRRHKPQSYPSHRDPQPESGGCHTTGKCWAVSHPSHEGYDPSPECHLDSNVSKQEKGTEPGDPCRWLAKQCLSKAPFIISIL